MRQLALSGRGPAGRRRTCPIFSSPAPRRRSGAGPDRPAAAAAGADPPRPAGTAKSGARWPPCAPGAAAAAAGATDPSIAATPSRLLLRAAAGGTAARARPHPRPQGPPRRREVKTRAAEAAAEAKARVAEQGQRPPRPRQKQRPQSCQGRRHRQGGGPGKANRAEGQEKAAKRCGARGRPHAATAALCSSRRAWPAASARTLTEPAGDCGALQ